MGQSDQTSSRPAPRLERSAGIILFRRDKKTGRRVYLLLDYGKYWDFPKGHVEKAEDDRSAAIRELEEETGIRHPDFREGFAREITYYFKHPKRSLVKKTVIFFLASTQDEHVRLSEEHVGSAWVDEDQAVGRVKYATAKQVLQAAIEFLAAHANSDS